MYGFFCKVLLSPPQELRIDNKNTTIRNEIKLNLIFFSYNDLGCVFLDSNSNINKLLKITFIKLNASN